MKDFRAKGPRHLASAWDLGKANKPKYLAKGVPFHAYCRAGVAR
jgi:hypothetical protein